MWISELRNSNLQGVGTLAMCYCERVKDKEFCDIGPCNEKDVNLFQASVVEHYPEHYPKLTKEILLWATKAYAKDMKQWEFSQEMLRIGKKLSLNAAEKHDSDILKIITDDVA